jgi:hypothetical protein
LTVDGEGEWKKVALKMISKILAPLGSRRGKIKKLKLVIIPKKR